MPNHLVLVLMSILSTVWSISFAHPHSLPQAEPAHNSPNASQAPGSFAKTQYTTDLRAVCPDPLIIQKDWLMQPEHAAVMQLIGGIGEDAGRAEVGRYSGPLGSSGIELVLLEGGAGIGMGDGETAYFTLHAGNSKAGLTPHLAFVSTATALIFSGKFPTTAVVAPLERNPQALIYDPARYPEGFTGLESLIELANDPTAKIYVTSTAFGFAKFLVDAGVPQDIFVEGYRGDLENFVSHDGAWLNQGLVTSELWSLTHGRNWQRPVGYSLLSTFGYDTYPSALAVASQRLEELAPCLERFVPMLQQAQVDYIRDPHEVNEAIIDFNAQGFAASYWDTPRGMVESMVEIALDTGVFGDGNNETLGDFDMTRVTNLLESLRPSLDDRARPELDASDVVTNRFIDPSIGLSH